jgi:hypothetical protein
MTAADRVAELGELLAAAVQRLLARGIKAAAQPRNSRDHLDDVAAAEASSGPATKCPA